MSLKNVLCSLIWYQKLFTLKYKISHTPAYQTSTERKISLDLSERAEILKWIRNAFFLVQTTKIWMKKCQAYSPRHQIAWNSNYRLGRPMQSCRQRQSGKVKLISEDWEWLLKHFNLYWCKCGANWVLLSGDEGVVLPVSQLTPLQTREISDWHLELEC